MNGTTQTLNKISAVNNGSRTEPPEKILITKGKAGLGNRLLAVLGSILYCSATGRLLYVDWTDHTYSEDGENVFGYAFKCSARQAVLDRIPREEVYPPIWSGKLERSITALIDEYDPEYWNDEMRVYDRYSMRLENTGYEEPVVVRWSYFDDFSGLFPKLGYGYYSERLRFNILKKVISDNFEIAGHIKAEVRDLAEKLSSGDSIGVHVRYTDNKCPYRLILRKLSRVLRQKNNAVIFLATDNKVIEDKIKARYPGRIITFNKRISENGAPLHGSGHDRKTLKEAVSDMYLLSRCSSLIFSSQSSLGYCAALFSRAQEKDIVDCRSLSRQLRAQMKCAMINLRVWKEKLL